MEPIYYFVVFKDGSRRELNDLENSTMRRVRKQAEKRGLQIAYFVSMRMIANPFTMETIEHPLSYFDPDGKYNEGAQLALALKNGMNSNYGISRAISFYITKKILEQSK